MPLSQPAQSLASLQQMMEKSESICMSEYSYEENLLYRSKDSEVYKAVNRARPGEPAFAFKGYSDSCLSDPQRERTLMQELNSLWRLHGKQNILQIVSQHSRDHRVFIITEFCDGGTLAQQIQKEGRLSEQKSLAYLRQIVTGYAHIYAEGLLHRNLEPSSILSAGFELKIGDFSDSIKQTDAHLAALREEIVGNFLFQPFEVLSAYKYSPKSDVYSIGATLFCMLRGRPPFEGLTKNEVLAKMKNADLKAELSSFRNARLAEFLEKTLQVDESLRMSAEELFGFEFEWMPQLNKLKLYTFDDRDSLLVEEEIGVRGKLDSIKETARQRELEESMRQLFRNFQTSEKKFSAIDLKVSDEDELSKLYRDREISIFIPTKMELPHEDELGLGLDHIQSIEKRPSEGLPLRKRAGTNREITNNTYSDLLKSQVFSKNKLKNETAKCLTVTPEEPLEQPPTEAKLNSTETQKIKETSNTVKPDEKSAVCINLTNQSEVVPPLEFKPEKTTNRKPTQAYQPKSTTERSNVKGPFTLRGRENIVCEVSRKAEPGSSAIAGWLISQIDMFRFLNRICFKIKKIARQELTPLSEALQRLKMQLLADIKNLTHLPKREATAFEASPEGAKIREILAAYEGRTTGSVGVFEGHEKLNAAAVSAIGMVFAWVSSEREFREEEIKLLDYLITLWQLLKLLKRNSLEHFHNHSKIAQIIDSKELPLTIAHLLHIYDRMKALKLI